MSMLESLLQVVSALKPQSRLEPLTKLVEILRTKPMRDPNDSAKWAQPAWPVLRAYVESLPPGSVNDRDRANFLSTLGPKHTYRH